MTRGNAFRSYNMDSLYMVNLKPYLALARPRHHIKNGFVLVPLFFSHDMAEPAALTAVAWTVICFCLAASAVYVLNDLTDMYQDRDNPGKQKRPLASGEISPTGAGVYAAILFGLFLLLGFLLLNRATFLVIAGYVAFNAVYTLLFQYIVVADLLAVSFGFVLRVVAGGTAIHVEVSWWLIWMSFLLALFLVTAKRRNDMVMAGVSRMAKGGGSYTLTFFACAMIVVAVVAVTSYGAYVFSPAVAAKHGSHSLYWTLIPVLVGFSRYLWLIFVRRAIGSPVAVFYRDSLIQVTVAAWVGLFWLIFYTDYL